MERRLPKLGMGPVLVACFIVVVGTTMMPVFAAGTGNSAAMTEVSASEQAPTDCGCANGDDNDIVDIDGNNNTVKIVIDGESGEVTEVVRDSATDVSVDDGDTDSTDDADDGSDAATDDSTDGADAGAGGAADADADDGAAAAAGGGGGGAADVDVTVEDGDVVVNGEDVADEGDGMSDEDVQAIVNQILNNLETDTTVDNEDIVQIVEENNINGGNVSGVVNVNVLVQAINNATADADADANASADADADANATDDGDMDGNDTDMPGDGDDGMNETAPDIGVTKTANMDEVELSLLEGGDVLQSNEAVTFTVEVTNEGNATAEDVVVNDDDVIADIDDLSNDTTAFLVTDSSTSQGDFSAATGDFEVGTLEPGESATLTFDALVVSSDLSLLDGSLAELDATNEAELESVSPDDPNADNNAGSDTVTLVSLLDEPILGGASANGTSDTAENMTDTTENATEAPAAVGSLPLGDIAFGGLGLVGLLGSVLLLRRN